MDAPTTAPRQPQASDTARWFTEEVHPHGVHLKSYLIGRFPSVRDVDDVVQESFLRVWKARAAQPIHSAKAFLFQVGRRIALDVLKRERRSPTTLAGDLSSLVVIEEGRNAAQALADEELIGLVGDAVVALPQKTRDVIILYKFDGLSQADIAAKLGTTEKAVEHQVARGMKLCRRYLEDRGYALV